MTRATGIIKQTPVEDPLTEEIVSALQMACGVIAWAVDHGAGAAPIKKHVKRVLAKVIKARDEGVPGRGEGPGIHKYLDVSTGHISPSDMRLLDRDGRPRLEHGIISVPHDYGAWIHAVDYTAESLLDVLRVLREAGFSESFIKVLILAKATGCRWINIDQDGPILRGLDRYEW